MKAYILGPPPEDKVLRKESGTFKGVEPLHRSIDLEIKDEEGRLTIDEIDEDEKFFLSMAHKSRRLTAGYGGAIKRRVLVVPISENVTEEQFREGTVDWDEVLGPIQPWEAWVLCEKADMRLQGIEYRDGSGRIRIWLEDDLDYGSAEVALQPKGCGPDEIIHYLHAVHQYQEAGEAEEIREKVQFLLDRTLHLDDEDFTHLLVTVGSMFTIDPSLAGWRVSDVWRRDEEAIALQAEKFNLKPKWLKERLRRRKRAEQRTYKKRKMNE